MSVVFIDVDVDGDKLDNATAETLEGAIEAAQELARDTNGDPEVVALTLLWNSILSLPGGEEFIQAMTTFTPSLPVPPKKTGGCN